MDWVGAALDLGWLWGASGRVSIPAAVLFVAEEISADPGISTSIEKSE